MAVGFLSLPADVFRSDPDALAGLPAHPTPFAIPGYGGHPWWDAPAKRWVPVSLNAVSPDGQQYVYFSADGVHLTTLAGPADRVLYKRPSGVMGGQILAFQSDGVYIDIPSGVKTGGGGSYSNPTDQVGVWRIDKESGASVRIIAKDAGGSVAAGAIWSVQSGPVDDFLARIDLSSGVQTEMFTDPGRLMQFLGFDQSGLPIVWTFAGGHLEIWRVVSQNNAINFYSEDYTGNASIYPPEITQGDLISDRNGVWFGSVAGLYLYGASRFSKVASTPGIPAGPCES